MKKINSKFKLKKDIILYTGQTAYSLIDDDRYYFDEIKIFGKIIKIESENHVFLSGYIFNLFF
jgi:hypothetical protein